MVIIIIIKKKKKTGKGEGREETESQRGARDQPGLPSSRPAKKTLGTFGKAHLYQVSPHGFTRKLPRSLLFPIIPGKGKLRS